MTARTNRPLVVDVSLLLSGRGGPAERATAAALAALSREGAALVRADAAGLVTVSAAALAAHAATLEQADPFDAVRAWLLGQGPRPAPPVPVRRSRGFLFQPWPAAAFLPPNAIVLAAGLDWWDAPRIERQRTDVSIVGLIDMPVGLDWPDYVSAAEAGATPRRLAAMVAGAALVIAPGEVARERLQSFVATLPRPPLVRMVVPPALSQEPIADDPALAAAGYFLAIDRIEARANTALLLHLWRDALHAGGPVPRLVLAGERGAQIEEIKPLIDWNQAIRRHVAEAPGLSRAALAHLAAHARAVLAPAFAPADGSLLADIAALGTPLIAAEGAGADGLREAIRLSPIDGPGWRRVIVAAQAARTDHPRPAAAPPHDTAASILALAAAL